MASCNSVASKASKYWNEYQGVLAVVSNAHPAISAADKALRAADKMTRMWNSIFGSGGARIGPRKLPFGEKQKGRLATTRQFMTERNTKKQARLRFEKIGGKARKAKVRVCTFSANGRHREIKTFEVKRSDPKGKTWTATVPAGKLVSVLMSKPAGTNLLQYELKITE